MSDITQAWRFGRERLSPEAVEAGRRLRERRHALEMNLLDAANRVGVSISRLSDIERGRCLPTPGEADALRALLGEVTQ
jgi:transcriptional regulator with XRE-family HTH domain